VRGWRACRGRGMKCLELGLAEVWDRRAGGERRREAMDSRVGGGRARERVRDCTMGCSGARAMKVQPGRVGLMRRFGCRIRG